MSESVGALRHKNTHSETLCCKDLKCSPACISIRSGGKGLSLRATMIRDIGKICMYSYAVIGSPKPGFIRL